MLVDWWGRRSRAALNKTLTNEGDGRPWSMLRVRLGESAFEGRNLGDAGAIALPGFVGRVGAAALAILFCCCFA